MSDLVVCEDDLKINFSILIILTNINSLLKFRKNINNSKKFINNKHKTKVKIFKTVNKIL